MSAAAQRLDTWVEPATAIQSAEFASSTLENLCAHVYPTPSFFFRLQAGDDPVQHYKNLRRGLARVLCEMPHLAGTLKTDSRGSFGVVIPEAPGAGVRFHYRDLSNDKDIPSFEQLARAEFPFANCESDGLAKLRPTPFPACVDGDPVMIAQLTHLRGGLVLNGPITHMVADLVQPNVFAGRWAAHTREVVAAALEGRPEAALPSPCAPQLVDRSQLLPSPSEKVDMDEVRRLSKSLTNWTLLDPEKPQEVFDILSNLIPKARLVANDLRHPTNEVALRKSISGIWRFPAGQMKAMHAAVLQAAPNGERLSIIDMLTAFIWQRYFIAKYVPGERSDVEVPEATQIVYAGDVRGRLNPPLPAGFLGAAVDLFHVELPSAFLCSPATSPSGDKIAPKSSSNAHGVAQVAAKIRHSNSSWSLPQFNLMLRLASSTPTCPAFLPRGPFDLLVTDHTRGLNLSGADWGPGLGQPVTYREPYFGREPPLGEITFLAKALNGDIEAMIAGETVTMRRLAADKEMSRAGAKMLWLMDDSHTVSQGPIQAVL